MTEKLLIEDPVIHQTPVQFSGKKTTGTYILSETHILDSSSDEDDAIRAFGQEKYGSNLSPNRKFLKSTFSLLE
jgi:hypothetical protein